MKHQILDANPFGWGSGANLEKKSFTWMGLAYCVLLRCPYAQGVLRVCSVSGQSDTLTLAQSLYQLMFSISIHKVT